MNRSRITVLVSLLLVTGLGVPASYAAESLPSLSDKTVYYTDDYISGDCILSSAKSMIRRAAVARGSDDWDTITNTSLRDYATLFGTSFRNSFSYSNDGISYEVANLEICGDAAEKLSAVTGLIASHPEGVIIWGPDAAENGPHAVLVTGYSDGELYAVDSVYNTNDLNEGIQIWGDTTMKTIDFCNNVWYLCDIEGGIEPEILPNIAEISETVAEDTRDNITGSVQAITYLNRRDE